MNLKIYIHNVPNFPVEGILFRDITPLLKNAEAFKYVIEELGNHVIQTNAALIAGIESRGFLFGTTIAHSLDLPFVPIRKAGKLPGAILSEEYALEYGTGRLDIHANALEAGTRTYLIDDLLATGGTAMAATHLIEKLGGILVGAGFVIELNDLKGRNKLAKYDVKSLVSY